MSSPARIMIDGIGQWVVCHELSPSKPITSIGRASDCAVQLKHLRVSSNHAEIRPKDGGFIVKDLGSRNGTLLNGEALKGEARLNDGDVITINPFTLRFQDFTSLQAGQTFSGASVEELLARRQRAREQEPLLQVPKVVDVLEHVSRQLEDFCGEGSTIGGDKKLLAASNEWRQALREARHTSQRLATQLRMLRQVLLAESAQDAYGGILKTAATSLKAEVAFMMMINRSTKKWEVQCSIGDFQDAATESEEGQPKATAPISLTLVTQAVKEKKTLLTEDLPSAQRDAAASIILNSIQSGIAAPIIDAAEVIGCLYFDRREDLSDVFEKEQAADASSFAEVFRDAVSHFVAKQSTNS